MSRKLHTYTYNVDKNYSIYKSFVQKRHMDISFVLLQQQNICKSVRSFASMHCVAEAWCISLRGTICLTCLYQAPFFRCGVFSRAASVIQFIYCIQFYCSLVNCLISPKVYFFFLCRSKWFRLIGLHLNVSCIFLYALQLNLESQMILVSFFLLSLYSHHTL